MQVCSCFADRLILAIDKVIICIYAAQAYGLQQLLQKCIDFVRCKSFTELQKDPYFKRLEPGNLIRILQLRVLDLESTIDQVRIAVKNLDGYRSTLRQTTVAHNIFCHLSP